MNKKGLFLSLLSALFYILASPSFDIEFLGWIALTPLLATVSLSKSMKEAFWGGFIAGVAAYCGLCYWLITTMVSYGGLGYVASFFSFLFLNFYLALYWALFTLFLKRMSQRGLPVMITAPFLWVTLEYVRTYLFTGHPWALIAYTQYKNIYAIQLADCFGVYGISFILVLSSTLVFQVIFSYVKEKKRDYKAFAGFAILLLLTFYYGYIKVNGFREPEQSFTAALVQGNIDQAVKWDATYKTKTISIYEDLSQKAFFEAGKQDIIIWPETAVPFYFQQPSRLRHRIFELSENLDSPLIFGSPAYSIGENKKISYLNSAFLIRPDKQKGRVEVVDRYDKIHLVPFGEYVPLKKFLFFIDKITNGIGDFTAGAGVKTLNIEEKNIGKDKISFGPLICYEAIFPGLVRKFVKEGANVLVNITNDGWYGKTSAPYQHLSAVIFRSVENGVYMLRAANTGVSAIIDPLGRIVKKTQIYEEAFLSHRISINSNKTIYTRYGDFFAVSISIFTLALLFVSFKAKP